MIGRAYRLAQILSIDIVIGVVVLLRFFCAQMGVSAGWEVYVLLSATVWLIYTADHLRDAEKSPNSVRSRYQFHQRYRKQLVIISVSVLIMVTPLIFFIPMVIFIGGIALAIFSFVYLLVQHRLSRFLSKELYVAFVYTMGILMVPMLLSKTFDWSLLLLLFLLTSINLIIFSWYEKAEDETDKFKSIATELKDHQIEKLLFILLSIGLAVSLMAFNYLNAYFALGFIIYSLMLLAPVKFKPDHRYRAVGDGVFLLPILFEWL